MKKPTTHDAYIESAGDFALPILEKIRNAMHKACPEVEETMKWGTPHFDQHGIMAGMAAFKQHVNFGFWKGKQLSDPEGLLEVIGKTQVGTLRLEKLSDLPSQRVLVQYIKEAAQLNEETARSPKQAKKKTTKKASAKTVSAPSDLMAALKKRKKALTTFDGFSYSHRKEYLE